MHHQLSRCSAAQHPPSPLLHFVENVPTHPPVARLQLLESSVRRSNPSLDLAVMLVRSELGAGATQRIMEMNVTIFFVEPLRYGGEPRCAALPLMLLRSCALADGKQDC